MVASPAVAKSDVAEDFKGSHERFDEYVAKLPFIMDGKWFPVSWPLEVFLAQDLRIDCVMEDVVLEEKTKSFCWRYFGSTPSHFVSCNVR